MKAILFLISGILISAGTFAAWYWLNAVACAMNTTGCKDFTLNWSDWETLQLFVPTFVLGLILMAFGFWLFKSR